LDVDIWRGQKLDKNGDGAGIDKLLPVLVYQGRLVSKRIASRHTLYQQEKIEMKENDKSWIFFKKKYAPECVMLRRAPVAFL
jgi:hypothetical protein